MVETAGNIAIMRYRGYVLLTDREGTDIKTAYGTTIDHVAGEHSQARAQKIIDGWLHAI